MDVVKKKREYVNNEDFMQALIQYKTDCIEAAKIGGTKPAIPNYIGSCWLKIAEGLSHSPKFINYTFREEMIGDGIENCLMYFENFDPTISKNAFAYFTQIIYYAFLRRIQKEKKQMYVKYKSTEQSGILDEYEMFELEDGTTRQFEMYDNISEFIQNYESSKQAKKKEKAATKKAVGVEAFMEN